MDGRGRDTLDERVEHLERSVEDLRAQLRRALPEETAPAPRETRTGGATGTSPLPRDAFETAARRTEVEGGSGSRGRSVRGLDLPLDTRRLGDWEWWLNKVGIGLLLLGVVFLFAFSVERGWLPPVARVGAGLSVGAMLILFGLRLSAERRAFAQVLMGGGIGALYISGFAAFQLYDLAPYPLVFGFMVAVTLAAYALSLRQDEPALSIIGALGGLGTPFFLYSASGSLRGLVLYTCLILAGTTAVYYRKGWASLPAVSSAGVWLVLAVGYAISYPLSHADRWTLQLGVVLAWLLLWLVPIAREVLADGGSRRASRSAHVHAVSTPVVALGFTGAIWALPPGEFTPFPLAAAGIYAVAALALRTLDRTGLARTHALVAVLFLTHALVLFLDGETLFITLAAEASILHLVARRISDKLLSAGAHLLFAAVAVSLAARLVPGILDGAPRGAPTAALTPLLNARALVDLAVVALLSGSSRFVLSRELRLAYRVAAYAALLALLWREFSMLPGSAGDWLVTVSWGLCAVALLVVGARLGHARLVRGGMATLALVVGRLFLVDLAGVEPLARVLLFSGFGILFLALGYYLRRLWQDAHRRDGA